MSPAQDPQITQLHRAAQEAMQQGQLRDAHQYCLSILKLDQKFADAWFLCGLIAAHNSQAIKAVEIISNAVTLAPSNPEYRAELGKQLLANQESGRALAEAERSLALQPDDPPTLNTLGTLFSHTGEHHKALQCYNKAINQLESRPAGAGISAAKWRAELYFNAGASRRFAGDFDGAESAYEKAITLQPNLIKAHSALATLRPQTAENNHLERLNTLYSKTITAHDQLLLGHAMAKELEDMGEYQQSLEKLHWAKSPRASAVAYNAQENAQYFDRIKELYNDQLMAEGIAGCDSEEPIFIIGMPRTGTTLLEQILASHSAVFAAGELHNFPSQVKTQGSVKAHHSFDMECLESAVHMAPIELGQAYVNSTRPRTGHTPHFIDKLPLNCLYSGAIRRALPQARIICLRRDPMDTCLSNYRQQFAFNFSPYYYNLNLLDCGRYYIEFDKLIRHWQTVMPGAILEINYENLVEKPEQACRELLTFCGLSWEEECLSFHTRKSSVATPSAVQVRQGIYTSSVNRWRRYGDAMQPLYDLLKSAGYYS